MDFRALPTATRIVGATGMVTHRFRKTFLKGIMPVRPQDIHATHGSKKRHGTNALLI